MKSSLDRVVASLALSVLGAGAALAQEASPDGEALFNESCRSCHDGSVDRAPDRQALGLMRPEQVLAAMETGPMISMAVLRSAEQRRSIAEFVTGRKLSGELSMTPAPEAMCRGGTTALGDPLAAPLWNGWGRDASNTRFQSADDAGLDAADVPRLALKWAFGFPGDLSSNAQAILAAGRVFVGSPGGYFYALDAESGCIHWYLRTDAPVRAAASIGRIERDGRSVHALFLGDQRANAYALDAASGQLLWKTRVDDFPLARITGSPRLHDGRLYVPVASGEEGAGAAPGYECCRFRGSLVALNAATGEQIWKTYTIDEPRPTKKNAAGMQLWGPSGAPIWTSPAIDEKRHAIYVTTGDNYSDPSTGTSDAFMALELDTGKVLWQRQMTSGDAYTSACRLPDSTNCPDSGGPDFDFASSPILVTLRSGGRALVAGQKSGVVHALDPDRGGAVLWQVRVAKGGTMGGVQWGSAADAAKIYVAISDLGRIMLAYSRMTDADPTQGGGLVALDLATGKQAWRAAPPRCGDRPRCSPAQSAAVSGLPGVVFSGSMDGHLRAYSAEEGEILWDFDTVREYETVNGVPGRGGSMDGPGPAIGGGMVFVNSGYVTAGGMPGNVLLAFSVDGR
jgi:polyvinyl alcohol dehydrogenase (cytochrome)